MSSAHEVVKLLRVYDYPFQFDRASFLTTRRESGILPHGLLDEEGDHEKVKAINQT